METSRVDQKCIVERVNNGYILEYKRIYNDDSSEIQKELYVDDEDNIKSFYNMVCDLMDIFGVYNCSIKLFDKDGKEIEVE